MVIIDIALLITIVIALTEVFKHAAKVPNKYLPLLSVVLGIIGGVVYLEGSLKETILYGIIIGLSASGLFDQSKIIKKDDE